MVKIGDKIILNKKCSEKIVKWIKLNTDKLIYSDGYLTISRIDSVGTLFWINGNPKNMLCLYKTEFSVYKGLKSKLLGVIKNRKSSTKKAN